MPQRQLTPEEWALAIRMIEEVVNWLSAVDGATAVEAGVDIEDADETTMHTMDTRDLVQRLAAVQRLLGFEEGIDKLPPPIGQMLPDSIRPKP